MVCRERERERERGKNGRVMSVDGKDITLLIVL
jgi:hypothetical protein